MTFISYAQNFEDLMLFRALKGIEHGFYIDIGAGHPTENSVTHAFYRMGWKGINVEPVDSFYNELCNARPNDINIKKAISSYIGTIELNLSTDSGLSTINNDFADLHRKSGFHFERVTVPCTTLDDICAEFGVQTVHFLKIDVEGSEEHVIEGFSFDRVRPWILVIESTIPSTAIGNSDRWEKKVIDKDYRFAYFDGLNKFYIAREQLELEKFFKTPPNIFDGAITHAFFESQQNLHAIQEEYRQKNLEWETARNGFESIVNALKEENASASDTCGQLNEENMELKDGIAQHTLRIESLEKELNHFILKEKLLIDQLSLLSSTEGTRLEMPEIAALKNRIETMEEEIRKIYATLSWKLTTPLRHLKKHFLASFRKCSGSTVPNSRWLKGLKKLNPVTFLLKRLPRSQKSLPDLLNPGVPRHMTDAAKTVYIELEKNIKCNENTH